MSIQICGDRCFAVDNETSEYLQAMARKCISNYFLPAEWSEGIVSESFILHNNGSVSQISIIAHPKHYKTKRTTICTDKALILAVKNAAPFRKPPTNLRTPIKLILIIDVSPQGGPAKVHVNIATN